MIKNIVLDMGNVCCRWDTEYLSRCLTDNKDEQRFIIEKIFQSRQWQELDQGIITVDQAVNQLCQKYCHEKELIEKTLYHWFDYFDQFDEMEQYIIELKEQGYQIYLLSNCSMQFYQYYQNKSIFRHFHDYYISAKNHLVKPSLEIYKDFCQQFQLKAQECLFVDDMAVNVEAAKAIGMAGIVYYGQIQDLKEQIEDICQ